jgi:streptomycin 6-kinase
VRPADSGACVKLLRSDEEHNGPLLERLGPSIADYGMPLDERLNIFTAPAPRIWRPAAGHRLPTGADKGRWLIDFVSTGLLLTSIGVQPAGRQMLRAADRISSSAP